MSYHKDDKTISLVQPLGLGLVLCVVVGFLLTQCNSNPPSSTDPMVSHLKNQAKHMRNVAQQLQQP